MRVYREKEGKIWKAKGYPLSMSGVVDELEELVKENEWLRARQQKVDISRLYIDFERAMSPQPASRKFSCRWKAAMAAALQAQGIEL